MTGTSTGRGERLPLKNHTEEHSVYEVEITPECLRHPNRLPEKVREAGLATILGPAADDPQ